MERRRPVLVDALDVTRTEVGEPEPAARIRDDDLAGVDVPREDQVEGAVGKRRAMPGKWQRRMRRSVDSSVIASGLRLPARVGPRIDADDLDGLRPARATRPTRRSAG